MARTKQTTRTGGKQRRTKQLSANQAEVGKRALGPGTGKMAAGPGLGKGFSGYARFGSATRCEQSIKAQAAARHFLGQSPASSSTSSPAESPMQSPLKSSARVRWTLVPVGESRSSTPASACRSRRASTEKDSRDIQQPQYNRVRAQSENLLKSASASKENVKPLPNRNWSLAKSEEKPAPRTRTVSNKKVVRTLFQLKADVGEFVPQCHGTVGPIVSEQPKPTPVVLKANVPEFVPQCEQPRVLKKKDKEYVYDPQVAQQIKQRKKEKKKQKKMKKQLEELAEKQHLLHLAVAWPKDAGLPQEVAVSLRDTEDKMRALQEQQRQLAATMNVHLVAVV